MNSETAKKTRRPRGALTLLRYTKKDRAQPEDVQFDTLTLQLNKKGVLKILQKKYKTLVSPSLKNILKEKSKENKEKIYISGNFF
jgi:hypothetical protein